ncbi:MAG: CPn0927/CPn0928 family alpha/beta hydrolase fold protein [Chlamydiota bacterium]
MTSAAISLPNTAISFHDALVGSKAFYAQRDYLQVTKRDFSENNLLPITYTSNTEYKIIRIVKQIFLVLIFPLGMYMLLHSLVGKIVLPASSPTCMGYSKNHANEIRPAVVEDRNWKYKRITVEVDGYKIDAAIVGTPTTLHNGRWMLASGGNGEFYEGTLSPRHDFKHILSQVHSNGIVFNYPGVGASSGLPNRQAMAKAYHAMLSFLEDRENGVGAKEIIGYGHSIGGAVQGDALQIHELKKDVKYVFVKSRTFSNLSNEVSSLMVKPLGFLIKILGWNIDSVESSKKLQAPEIIMQTASVNGYKELKDSSKIIDEDIISSEASLAKALLYDNDCPKENKVFIGMHERHNDGLRNPSFLARKIESLLKV